MLGPSLLRGRSTPSWWWWSRVTVPAAGSDPFCLDYISSRGQSSTTTSTSIVHLYKNLFEQKVDPLRTQGMWPRAFHALGPAGSLWGMLCLARVLSLQDRLVVLQLLPFPMVFSWVPFGRVLCFFELLLVHFAACILLHLHRIVR